MWDIEEIPELEQLPPADQLWIIALAIEENAGPAEYARSLRRVADLLDELTWWLAAKGPGARSLAAPAPACHPQARRP